ncbi:MAG: polysaccharide deacetylase family protein [Candidatus Thorarchaeota archaeon]
MSDEHPALAIRVDVDTREGVTKGIPIILEILDKSSEIKASFFLAMGPDHTGRNIRRILKFREFSKIHPKSLAQYSPRSLLSGIFLGRNCLDGSHMSIIKEANRNGNEFGLHGYNHYYWATHFRKLDNFQQIDLLERGIRDFYYFMRERPTIFATPAFKWTKNLFFELDRRKFLCSGDFRFKKRIIMPFRLKFGSHVCSHLQLPVTYPLPSDLLLQGASEGAVIRQIVRRAKELIASSPFTGVFYIHAAIEPLRYQSLFKSIIAAFEHLGIRFLTFSQLTKEFAPQAPILSISN